jgi:hypothetical protein
MRASIRWEGESAPSFELLVFFIDVAFFGVVARRHLDQLDPSRLLKKLVAFGGGE